MRFLNQHTEFVLHKPVLISALFLAGDTALASSENVQQTGVVMDDQLEIILIDEAVQALPVLTANFAVAPVSIEKIQ